MESSSYRAKQNVDAASVITVNCATGPSSAVRYVCGHPLLSFAAVRLNGDDGTVICGEQVCFHMLSPIPV
jgi:hypothetical protein